MCRNSQDPGFILSTARKQILNYFFFNYVFKNKRLGAEVGEMAQQLRALYALPEDLRQSLHQLPIITAPGEPVPCLLQAPEHTYMYIHMYIHTYILNAFQKVRSWGCNSRVQNPVHMVTNTPLYLRSDGRGSEVVTLII